MVESVAGNRLLDEKWWESQLQWMAMDSVEAYVEQHKIVHGQTTRFLEQWFLAS